MSATGFSLIALLFLLVFASGIALFFWFKSNKTLPEPSRTLSSGKHNYKTIFGHKIYYTQEGNGDHVLMIHGIGASHYVWRFLTPKLSKKFTVTALDLLGFGLSDKPQDFKYDLDSQCEIILKLVNELEIKKCILIGSSMGGTIALRLTQMHPEIFVRTIALSPAADPRITFFDLNRISFLSPVVKPLVTEKFVKQIMKRVYAEKSLVTDENIKIYTEPYSNDKGAIDSFVKSFSLLRDPRVFEQLSIIKTPVLILWGEKDKIIPLKFAKKIQSKISKSELYTHPKAGHHVQEDDPQWVLNRIFSFLKV